MKKGIGIAIGLLILVAAGLVQEPVRDHMKWQWVSSKDQVESYWAYIQEWPEGRHIEEARERFDELGWAEARAANTVGAYADYLFFHEEGQHKEEAKDRQDWLVAVGSNVLRHYQTYLTHYPDGRFADEAETKVATLRVDEAPYQTALERGTETALESFLHDFPGHEKEPEARQLLTDITEGRDIVDLIQAGLIEVEAAGRGIQRVRVRARRLVPYPLRVRIPVATFFVSSNPAAQNMITTAAATLRLTSDDWQETTPAVACANRSRDVPESGDSFRVRRSPQQAELVKLMPVLDRARVDSEARQAAVWIVTDNADYGDLGILVVSQFGFGGSRAIREEEAARAMQICDRAGIDITRKAIWRDRQRILSGLEDSDLKTWLEEKG